MIQRSLGNIPMDVARVEYSTIPDRSSIMLRRCLGFVADSIRTIFGPHQESREESDKRVP